MLFENTFVDQLLVQTYKSPVGDFSYVAAKNLAKTGQLGTLQPIVFGIGFTSDQQQIVDTLTLEEQKIPLNYGTKNSMLDDLFSQYFTGNCVVLEQILVCQPGGSFANSVRDKMRKIPVGVTCSYQQLASEAGNVKAARAAGSACAKNRVALVVPCHRVVRSDGNLGGYAWGLEVKEKLLTHEKNNI